MFWGVLIAHSWRGRHVLSLGLPVLEQRTICDLNWPSDIFRLEPWPKQAGRRSPEPWQVEVAACLVCERQKVDSDLSQVRKICLTRSLWNAKKKPAGKSRIGSRYGGGERGGKDEEAEDRQEDHCQGVEWAGCGKFLYIPSSVGRVSN